MSYEYESYKYESYDNLNELKKVDSKLANELIQYSWTENWKDEYFLVFPNKVEFAKYEMEEGLGIEIIDWGGEINPLEYIDFKRLADDIIKSWDNSLCYVSDEGKIVRTSYGF